MSTTIAKAQFADFRECHFDLGRDPEDGFQRVGVRFEITADAEDGSRWVHFHRFDDRAAAQAFAARVDAALAGGRKLDAAHWYSVEPAYGSAAYVEQDVETDRWMEEREEAANGGGW